MLMSPEPYTREQYSKDFKQLCDEEHALTMAKNNDYGGETDPWKNFREFGLMGILVRMSDKWSRIKTALWEKRAFEVATETVEDTLKDLSVYCKIAILWIRRQKYEQSFQKQNISVDRSQENTRKEIPAQRVAGTGKDPNDYLRGAKFAPVPTPGQGHE